MRSIYRWAGEVRDEHETMLIVKTREDLFEPLARRVRELHPYEVPEVIALPIVNGLPEYLSWIEGETSI
jgi:periplasmic divalent cation tolerance protein